ncbi:MAG: DUF4625 domain-containing protein [Bacteroides sp.]|nr:DUF4625 domain-containing protein [Bacteroides sp.]
MKTVNYLSQYALCGFIVLLLTLSTLAASSCSSDDGNTTKPIIKLNAPAEGAILLIGDEHGIHLDMDLESVEALASYKVNIHPNFDGHGHTRQEESNTVDFDFTKVWNDIAGQKNAHVHHHLIVIPENATPGNYHLMIYCTDASANESYITRNIVLSHDGESGKH